MNEAQNSMPTGVKFATVESSGWRCELFGTGNALVLRPAKGRVPNAFWRLMQWLCFGNKWIKD